MTAIIEASRQDAPSPELLDFFRPMSRDFEPRRRGLPAARRAALQKALAGEPPGDQRNQITGPADNAELLVAMCNTKEPGCMPDGEDSITGDWANVRAAHRNVITAIKPSKDGVTITPELVADWFASELRKILAANPESATADKYHRASEWSQQMIKEAAVGTSTESAPEGIKSWRYPQAEFAKMYAPHEKVHPSDKLRALLLEKFAHRLTNPSKSFLHTAGAYDAMTASMLTDLGFEAIYASGWQLAVAHNMYPDIGIYPSHQMVELARELMRGIEGTRDRHFYDDNGLVLNTPPIFADIEAGFGGPTQTFTLTRELIRAGVGGVHLEDQDPAERTCGHIVAHHGVKREKVLVPTNKWIEKLIAVKAAAQASETNLVVIARTDAVDGAVPGGRSGSVQHAIDRALEAASLGVDVIWPEFNNTDLEGPQEFAEGVHKYYPNQMLGFNLSPSLHWGKAKKDGKLITNEMLGKMGFTLQFSTLLAFRTVGMALENSLKGFHARGIDALADL
ncbi:MAG: isocitrate lyase/phosphoenolpyruvate mutase family protein, partial [Elusimicrobiota bacterium]|nr:isocitrate lyase/phosphoenolpyruvate mutase family protein [Elusimicrobiota bacterium]